MLHGSRIKLAISLGPRSAHGRPFAAIEQAKLNAGGICNAAHQTIQRVDFTDQMAFAKPADGWVARHGADAGKALGDERGARAHASGSRCSFAAGMPTTDDNDVKRFAHENPAAITARSIRRAISGQRHGPLCFT